MSRDSKVKLINAIQEKGRFWEPLAISDAMDSARNPDNEDLRRKANASVLRLDYANEITQQIIDLIHSHWPKDQ